MNIRSCEINRAMSQEALILLTVEHERWPKNKRFRGPDRLRTGRTSPCNTIFQLRTEQINRLIVCGHCSKSGIDPELVEYLFYKGISKLIHRIDVYNEYGYDPEVSRIRTRARKKKWRDENQDYIVQKREEYRLDHQTERLKKLMEEDNEQEE